MERDTYDEYRIPERSWAVFAPHVCWRGRSVLDVGCHAGAMLRLANEAGATRLIGVDLNRFHNTKDHPEYERPFDRILRSGLPVELIEGDWLEVGEITADVVMCCNALHYMRDVDEATRKLFSAAREFVVLETAQRIERPPGWSLRLYGDSHWNGRRILVFGREK